VVHSQTSEVKFKAHLGALGKNLSAQHVHSCLVEEADVTVLHWQSLFEMFSLLLT
jgi:hypothetical protein